MANTIAVCIGTDKNGRRKEDHRLGSQSAEVQAATWHTTVTAYIHADGSGYVRVKRDGVVMLEYSFGPEGNHVVRD